MEIQERTITKTVRFIEFDGIKFYPDKRGYWLGQIKGTKKPIRLHTYVWEHYNGKVPKGYQVHHKDHNPDNNEIDNLELMTKHDHLSYHAGEESRAAWSRRNLTENARPKASEWHKSEAGRAWHKYLANREENISIHNTVRKTCQCCGKEFDSLLINSSTSRFCSNNCKAQWRRDAGIDNIEIPCPVCGTMFSTNKYARKKYCSTECRIIGSRSVRSEHSQSHHQE